MSELSSGSGEQEPEPEPELHVGDDDGLTAETWGIVGGISLLLIFSLCLFAFLSWKSPCHGHSYGQGGPKVVQGPAIPDVPTGVPVSSKWDDTRAVRLARAAQRALTPRLCPGSNEALETMPLLRIGV